MKKPFRPREISEYISKRMGYLMVLIRALDEPLVRYTRGGKVCYTPASLGPDSERPFNWGKASPVKFTEHQVEVAIERGFVGIEDEKVWLTRGGYSLARGCVEEWGREVYELVKDLQVDWHRFWP
jgi:hypothetical protein